ncbi:MAG: VOC family protein [Steroidobacteraceae bacterium]
MNELANAVPDGYSTFNPYITVSDVPALIEFLQRTFGGVVTGTIRQPDGKIEHVEIRVGDSLLMIGPPHVDALIRTHEEHRAGTFYVFVADVDATYDRALACGAGAWEAPNEKFYGDRTAAVTDTNGNVWWIAKRQRRLSAAELQMRADQRWRKKSDNRDTRAPGRGTSPDMLFENGTMREQGASKVTPDGYRTINSYLTVTDVLGLIDFLERTFDGVLTEKITQPDGLIEHAEIRVGNSLLMVGPPQVDSIMGDHTRHRSGTFYVFVPDVDDTFRRAVACGAEVWESPSDRFYGDRVAAIGDPNGNRWWIATRKRALTLNELQRRADEHWHVRTRAIGESVSRADLLEVLRSHRYAVEASIAADGTPEAALVEFVVNEGLELFFDSFDSTRKVANLRRDPRVAFVIGGQTPGDARTVQYEGTVDSPCGTELERFKSAYFATNPDGIRRSKLPGISYFRVRPRWIRYANFNAAPAQIVVFEGAALGSDHHGEGQRATSPYTQIKRPWQPRSEPDAVIT